MRVLQALGLINSSGVKMKNHTDIKENECIDSKLEEHKQSTEKYIEKRINIFLSQDANIHRQFLESMFKRVMWSFGIIIITVTSILYFVWGRSVDSAAESSVNKFIDEQNVTKSILDKVDDHLLELAPTIRENAKSEAKIAIEDEVSRITREKLAELKGLTIEELASKGLRGPKGDSALNKSVLKISNYTDKKSVEGLLCLLDYGKSHRYCALSQNRVEQSWSVSVSPYIDRYSFHNELECVVYCIHADSN